jgi:hypothetical protein
MAQAAGAVIGIGASLFGMYSQRQAMQEQQRAMREQRRMQRAADERERRQLLRQQAIASGQTVNVASQIGGLGSTGLTGGLSGLQNQVLSTLGFQGMTRRSVERQQGFLNQAAQYQTQAGIAQGIASIGPELGTLGSGLYNTGMQTLGRMANPIQSSGFGMRYV